MATRSGGIAVTRGDFVAADHDAGAARTAVRFQWAQIAPLP